MQVCHTASKVLRHPLSLYRCDTKLQSDVYFHSPCGLRRARMPSREKLALLPGEPTGGKVIFASRRQAV